MRELLNQDRALSPASIKLAITVLGLLFAVAAVIIALNGLLTAFTQNLLIGLLQISAGTGFLLAVYMVVRLQAETVMAAHRTNDRLMILNDALSPRVAAPAAPLAAKPKKKAPATKAVRAKAKPAAAETATDSTDT